MLAPPPIIDENGDLQLHGRQSGVIYFDFLNDVGAPLDMTGASVTFEVGPTVNVTLVSVGTPIQRMSLTLSNAIVKDIYAANDKEFVLNQGGVILMEGIAYARGWTE